MSLAAAIPVFIVSLVATLAAAAVFARRIDALCAHFGLPEGVIGVLTAAGADAPELSSAIVALASGASGAGLGVIVGSNVFNIAAMLGVSALLAGAVTVPRAIALAEGRAATAVALAVLMFATGLVPGWALVLLCGAIVAAYLVALWRGPRHPPSALAPHELRRALLEIVPALAVIVGGSVGMVHSALDMADRAGLSEVLVGTLLLAVLTSLPNAWTGVRLGRSGRGEALLSETMNSNTINLVGGVAVPSLVVAFAAPLSHLEVADVVWLLAATGGAALLVARPGGLGRAGGGLLVASWIGFAVVQGFFG